MLLALLLSLNAFAWSPHQSASDTASLTTSANITTVSVQVVPLNLNRLGFLAWNNSANSAYCCFAATCSSAAPTQIIPTFTSWVWNAPISYRGPIACIRNAGSGTVTITELQ
jgi:hypothetical protein